MAVRKYGSKKWQARWRDETGRQRAKVFDKKSDAEAFLKAASAPSWIDALAPNAGTITVAEVGAEFLASCIHLSPGTIEGYTRDLTRYAYPAFGDVPISKLTSAQIQSWLAEQLTRLAPSTVRANYRSLRVMVAWAIRVRYLANNPFFGVNAPRVPFVEKEYLTVEQVEAIADSIGDRYRAFVLVAAYSGARLAELTGLRRAWVNGNTITINEQLKMRATGWSREATKTSGSRRTITLPASIAEELREHMDKFTGPGVDDLVFINQHGNPIGASFRGNVWAPACYKAGLAHLVKNPGKATSFTGYPKFHSLRHTSVAICIAAGVAPKVIQQRLGHSSIVLTMNTYGHLMPGLDDAAAAAMDDLRPLAVVADV
jgi:integrase